MSNIDKQALRYGDNVLWFLNELAAYDAGDIDGGEFNVYGEDRNGLEGCSTIDVTELAADAAKLIEAAEKRIAELESALKEIRRRAFSARRNSHNSGPFQYSDLCEEIIDATEIVKGAGIGKGE
ncbi:hypothetical protein [Citrobacter farmeri]|uniref:hypothetical protein n=1 Tax=Citrobacter farmeri TaxID=67824 RepID=UPI0023AED0D6|nr:hypothetical protein [Citrobacter farmeri]